MEKEKEGFPITSLREVNTLLKVRSRGVKVKVKVKSLWIMCFIIIIIIFSFYLRHYIYIIIFIISHHEGSWRPCIVFCIVSCARIV